MQGEARPQIPDLRVAPNAAPLLPSRLRQAEPVQDPLEGSGSSVRYRRKPGGRPDGKPAQSHPQSARSTSDLVRRRRQPATGAAMSPHRLPPPARPWVRRTRGDLPRRDGRGAHRPPLIRDRVVHHNHTAVQGGSACGASHSLAMRPPAKARISPGCSHGRRLTESAEPLRTAGVGDLHSRRRLRLPHPSALQSEGRHPMPEPGHLWVPALEKVAGESCASIPCTRLRCPLQSDKRAVEMPPCRLRPGTEIERLGIPVSER